MIKTPSQMSEEELKKEIYKLRRDLRVDIRGVRELKKSSPLSPSYAIDKMAEIEKRMRETPVIRMDKKQLKDTLRDLMYTRNLKSSTVKGIQEAEPIMANLKDQLASLSKDIQDKFWDIYKIFYEDTKGLGELYKYEIFSTRLIDYVNRDTSAAVMAKNIKNIWDKINESYPMKTEDDDEYYNMSREERKEYDEQREQFKVQLFGSRLKNIFR